MDTKQNFISLKTIFTATILVATTTIITIWLSGLDQHQTLFINSILSTSVLASIFYIFLTIGLYKGFKLKHDLPKPNKTGKSYNVPYLSAAIELPSSMPEIGDGFEGILLGIVSWILFSLFLIVFIWVFGTVIWAILLVFTAMIYWIFFRALRLVFKKSVIFKGNIWRSMGFAFTYTILYTSWIYGIILVSYYLKAF